QRLAAAMLTLLLVRNLRGGRQRDAVRGWRRGRIGRLRRGGSGGRSRGGAALRKRSRGRRAASWRCRLAAAHRTVRARQLVEHTFAGIVGTRRRSAIENVDRLLAVAGDDGQGKRSDEEGRGQDRRRAGKRIGGAPRRHETGTAANAETTAFGALQQHHADKG